MRISDWSSDVCSSDLGEVGGAAHAQRQQDVAEHGVRMDVGAGALQRLEPCVHRGAEDVGVGGVIDPAAARRRLAAVVAAAVVDLLRVGFGEEQAVGVGRALVADRKSVVSGKSVSGRVVTGGRRIIKKKKKSTKQI